MVRRGRTLGDLMTSMRVANSKLRDRATRIAMAATGCDEDAARRALAEAGDDISVAIVMLAPRTPDRQRRPRGLLDGTSGGANLRAPLSSRQVVEIGLDHLLTTR